ncbi:MAG: Prophage endopeptidase tail [Bacteriophage sp.]|nr:MAG: Prophage endopeptidase tail [Bacteriophage sp.]
MRNLSTEFKEQQNSGNRNYLKYADFTFTDGSTLSITDKDLWSNGFKFEDAVSQNGSFDIGAAIINKLTLQINNFSGKYTDYIWDGARVVCHIGLELSTGIEKIRICTMTVTDAPYQSTAIISLTCEDSMRLFDRDYSESKLTYPATRLQIIQDACEVCGVTLQSTRFDNDDFVIQNRPDDSSITFRQVIAWVAQMGCQWAKCDEYGRLCFGWYEREVPDNFYDLVETPWKDVEGNDILDTTGEQIITIMQTGITAIQTNGFTPWLYDLEITGIKVTEYVENSSQNEAKTYQSGKSGYVIEISDNKLIQEGTGEAICKIISDRCVGMKFRPFSTGALTNIAWEAGDTIAISDRNGKQYKSYLTSVTLNPGAFEQLECSAKSASRNKQKQYSLNQQIQAENNKNLRDERTAREKALEELSQRLAESSGTYTTVETQPDGSKIYYLHNKPQLSDSDIIWKMTAEAWAVSTDGGQHWNGGMTVDGDVIARILTATGVNADWIKTGALVVRDNSGNIIFSADITKHQLIMDGSSIRIGASPLDGLLNSMQGQIDGNINTWTGTSVPTLSNYPANEWLDDTEMSKHVGDIYYDGDSHAYRFVNEGNGYYWKQLKDTDVTKALKDSEDALSAAKQAQEAAALAKNMTLQLSNEYQGVSVDSDGNYGTFPSDVITHAVVMYGTQDITDDCNFIITKSDSITGIWNNSAKTYTVTGLSADDGWVDVRATYLSALTVTKRFSISKIYAGNDGKNGLPGEPGRDGKTSYTHIAYANSADGKTDFSVSDSNREYIGIYVDFGLQDSTNPDDYAWTLVKGADGANGSPGKPGTDGRTPYFHVAYANSADGKMGFDVSDSTGKEYIGQYTDYTEADSTNPGAYSWTKIKGEQGVPGRTYFLESPSYVIKQRANGSVAPSYITLSAWYRDGNAETRTAYKGRFKIEESVDGENWKTVYSSAKDETSVSHNLYTVLSTKAGGIITTASGRSIGIPRDVSTIKCTLYAAGGFSQPLDSQSMAVVIDVDALTHEEIFNLLTNDGAIKGIYKEGNQLYISFTYAKGGTLKLGGKNNGYGILEVLNRRETGWASKLDPDGLTIFKDYVNENNYKCLIFDSSGIKYGVTDSAGLLNLEMPLLVNDNGTMTILTNDIYGYSDDGKTAFQFFSGKTVNSGSMIVNVKSDFHDSANFHKSVTMSGLPWNSSASAAVVFASDMKTLNAAAASSIRYKSIGNGKNIKEDELEDLYRIKVIWAKYKDGYLSEQDERYGKEMPMFIAEDIDRRFPLAVDHNEKGKAENWNYRIIIPCMFAMLKNDHEKILALQADNQELHSKLDALSTEVQELKELINNISRKE